MLFGANDGRTLRGCGEEELDGCEEGFVGSGGGKSEGVD